MVPKNTNFAPPATFNKRPITSSTMPNPSGNFTPRLGRVCTVHDKGGLQIAAHVQYIKSEMAAAVANVVCTCEECTDIMKLVYNDQTKAHDPDRFERQDLGDFICSICSEIAADAVQVNNIYVRSMRISFNVMYTLHVLLIDYIDFIV